MYDLLDRAWLKYKNFCRQYESGHKDINGLREAVCQTLSEQIAQGAVGCAGYQSLYPPSKKTRLLQLQSLVYSNLFSRKISDLRSTPHDFDIILQSDGDVLEKKAKETGFDLKKDAIWMKEMWYRVRR